MEADLVGASRTGHAGQHARAVLWDMADESEACGGGLAVRVAIADSIDRPDGEMAGRCALREGVKEVAGHARAIQLLGAT
eukprot:scaffold657084_cov38-Prasinocladus_malaysianus.AAC.1